MVAQPLIQLGERDAQGAEAIRLCSDAEFALIRPHLMAAETNTVPPPEVRALMKELGLMNECGDEWTPLGRRVARLALHERYQEHDELLGIIHDTGGEAVEGSVLEVGCSTGRLLRKIDVSESEELIGVDVDAVGLVIGYRCAKQESRPCQFCFGSAHHLPFPDGHFKWVICRNALTYMHQRKALGEMCRVLAPGGYLLIRYENVWYDLRSFTRVRQFKAAAACVRDAAWGVMNALTGVQPVPGVTALISRSFVATSRLRRTTQSLDCELVRVEPSTACPAMWGRRTQTTALSRKSISRLGTRHFRA